MKVYSLALVQGNINLNRKINLFTIMPVKAILIYTVKIKNIILT